MRGLMFMLAVVASPLAAQDAPPLFEAARTTPLSPGQWRYASSATGSEVRFAASFAIQCDRSARRVTLRRIASEGTLATSAMTIGTDLATRTLPEGGVVANTDRVLDAIAFSRGRFIVSGGGGRQLVLPASPEVARSVQDCRN